MKDLIQEYPAMVRSKRDTHRWLVKNSPLDPPRCFTGLRLLIAGNYFESAYGASRDHLAAADTLAEECPHHGIL